MGRGGLERVPAGGPRNAGRLRKLADQIGSSRWCLNRMWLLLVASASLITFVSLSSNSLLAAIVCPTKLVLIRHPQASSGELRWERRTETTVSQSSSLVLHSLDAEDDSLTGTTRKRPFAADTTVLSAISTTGDAFTTGDTPYIEDVVALPDGLDLFLVRIFADYTGEGRITACDYGDEERKSKPRRVDLVDRRLAVSCTRPSQLRQSDIVKIQDISLEVDGGQSPPFLPKVEYPEPARWDAALLYAVQSTEEDVILHVKGLFETKRRQASEYLELANFRCAFGESIETEVTAAALEVYRCAHPRIDWELEPQLARRKVHLLYKGHPIPSVAYYDASSSWSLAKKKVTSWKESDSRHMQEDSSPKHLVCSCTMIWNSARFLKEWVLFNSDLGVEKFYLYDNNSEDGIESVVSSLSKFNVTRIKWPWVKTQESGFSHCAAAAQKECTWIMFMDVDEYLFPRKWLQLNDTPARALTAAAASPSPLATLIRDTLQKTMLRTNNMDSSPLNVGQISFQCRNFGPSGLTESPSRGVTQGYTCREQREQRHKSLVFYPALKKSLQNVIHHFQLRPEYRTVTIDSRQAVVNHYKYQAWSEFETKFTRRASTYVADWREYKNLKSRDRPEGVGIDGKKPPDWETSHCERNDTALRDYTQRRFRVLDPDEFREVMMAWELL